MLLVFGEKEVPNHHVRKYQRLKKLDVTYEISKMGQLPLKNKMKLSHFDRNISSLSTEI